VKHCNILRLSHWEEILFISFNLIWNIHSSKQQINKKKRCNRFVISNKKITISNGPHHRRVIVMKTLSNYIQQNVSNLKRTLMTRYLPGSRAIFVNSSPSSAKIGRHSASTIQPVNITTTCHRFIIIKLIYNYRDKITSAIANAPYISIHLCILLYAIWLLHVMTEVSMCTEVTTNMRQFLFVKSSIYQPLR